MREFKDVQENTILIAKNFNNYFGKPELLPELRRKFGLRCNLPSSKAALTYLKRRLKRRVLDSYGEISIVEHEGVYALWAGVTLIARFIPLGDSLEIEALEKNELVENFLFSVENLYQNLKNFVPTEKMSEITLRFFKKQGCIPLRPERGDFYLLEDRQIVREFMETVEEYNLNGGDCFIVLRLDNLTVPVIRESFYTCWGHLKDRQKKYRRKKAGVKTLETLLRETKDFRVSLEILAEYFFSEEEKSRLLDDVDELISILELEILTEKNKKQGGEK